jgi:hypothetical protein
MFNSHQQSVGRDHTVTVALLAAAFVFIPALVAVSQPLSYLPAIGGSALCVILACFHWRSTRKASIPATSNEFKAAK